MNPFSAITSKIFAGVSIFLLIALIAAGFVIRSKSATIERQRVEIAECNAARAVQNAAIQAAAAEGDRQREAFAAANEAGQETIRQAQGRVTVVRQTARNACDTPPQVMGAGL